MKQEKLVCTALPINNKFVVLTEQNLCTVVENKQF